MFALSALVLSGASFWVSLRSYGMAIVIEDEQRKAVVVESARQDREDAQKRWNESQIRFNKKVADTFGVISEGDFREFQAAIKELSKWKH